MLLPDRVSEGDFGQLLLVPEEKLLGRRAQREELFKLLAAPTQSAGALDIPNNGGRTVFLYAAMHELRILVRDISVLKMFLDAGAEPEPELKDTDESPALLLAGNKEHTTTAEFLVVPGCSVLWQLQTFLLFFDDVIDVY